MNNQNQVLYRDKNASIDWNATSQCIVINTYGFLNSQQIVNLFEKSYQEYVTRNQACTSLIINAEKLGAVKKTEQDWLKNAWNQQMFQAGLKKLAIINADNIFGEVAIRTYCKNIRETPRCAIMTKTFKDIKSASQWIAD